MNQDEIKQRMLERSAKAIINRNTEKEMIDGMECSVYDERKIINDIVKFVDKKVNEALNLAEKKQTPPSCRKCNKPMYQPSRFLKTVWYCKDCKQKCELIYSDTPIAKLMDKDKEIQSLKDEKKELIERIYNELDNLNGERGHLCLYCDAEVYDGKQGIIHEQNCIIMRLREQLKFGSSETNDVPKAQEKEKI